jgi:ubiquinone/menaquinone biosynthesis C-methylase UbiE
MTSTASTEGGTVSPTVERLRRYWDSHAAGYDREMSFMERILFEDGRQWVCSNATGDVLEVAIGTGRNLPFYPPNVRLTGIEFSPAMLEIARKRAADSGRDVDLRLGDAQALDLPDAVFDTVVCTLSLCGIPDEHRAVREMKRVLKPGGRLILLDHILASPAWARAIQWLIERITIPLGGEHFQRRPRRTAEAEGFVVEIAERKKLGIVERALLRKPVEHRAK